MTDVNQLITDHLDVWTTAIEKKSSAGRGNVGGVSLYGVKKLRQLILELAVRGKLVPQLQNEGNGEDLKNEALRSRAAAIRAKRMRKQKELPEISDDEVPFQVPTSWALIRLGELTNYGVTDKAEARDMDDGVWVLELEDVEKVSSKLLQRVQFSERRFKSSKNRFLAGDVIYGKLRPYLDKVLIADEDGVCTTEMIPMRAFGDVSSDFLRLFLKSPEFIRYADDSTHGMNLPRLGTEKARMAVVPLPPLAEQHRIVAKVDELMALCDALERQAEDSLTAHQTLVETCLATLTNSQTPEDLTQNWTRIEAHFDTLFTTEESVQLLRSEISRMAVRGTISAPRDHHQSASQDLERSTRRKKELLTEGTVKVRKYPAMPTKVSEPISYPDHWRTVKMSDLFAVSGGIQKTPARSPKSNAYPYLGVGNVYRNRIDLSNVKSFELQDGELERYSLRLGDILIVEGNGSLTEIGRNAIWEGQMQNCVHQNHLIRCRPYLPEVVPFVSLFLNSPDGMDEMARLAITSSGLYSLSVGKISQIEVPFPPISEQDSVLSKFQDLRDICEDLERRLADKKSVQVTLSDTLTSKIH